MSKFASPIAPPKKKTPTYNFTRAQLDKLAEDAYRQGMAAAVPVVNTMYSAAMLLALNSQLGYGKRRMHRLFSEVQKYFEELRDGEISYADVMEELKAHGVTLTVETIEGGEEDSVKMFQRMNLPKLKVKWR